MRFVLSGTTTTMSVSIIVTTCFPRCDYLLRPQACSLPAEPGTDLRSYKAPFCHPLTTDPRPLTTDHRQPTPDPRPLLHIPVARVSFFSSNSPIARSR